MHSKHPFFHHDSNSHVRLKTGRPHQGRHLFGCEKERVDADEPDCLRPERGDAQHQDAQGRRPQGQQASQGRTGLSLLPT